ncbi:dihydroorotate dehydrogenase electron transfer subunit [Arcanobacterium pluranimalium]|uniref:dihydroorotate dehydrogenase electron transfer subunit n=1 Tax=Arcanobacterium pluranimalium TaxID=108028 RepID=UPI00195A2CF3|nr:dihydroorotate dehydrogenase electron transfer subunit [Arcanobacterium pluranimalium]MBM7824249.1 dihydroorotate dehydrogenase electron transfer subunit [Arcanobacterium pluranimalium]
MMIPPAKSTMIQTLLTVMRNREIARNIFEIKLRGDISAIKKPGQFVNIKVPGFSTRRPLSVCDVTAPENNAAIAEVTDAQRGRSGVVTLIYKVLGEGTRALSQIGEGERLDVLLGLGNGFDVSRSGSDPVLIGGGVGVPPLFLLARRLVECGVTPRVLLGFNTASEVFYEKEFRALGCDVRVCTVDGSAGETGLVTTALTQLAQEEPISYVYACGPHPLLEAIAALDVAPGELSFEERMACGFGVCMGCSFRAADGGYRRLCVEGPVVRVEEMAWNSDCE